jgi:hypothetical protein
MKRSWPIVVAFLAQTIGLAGVLLTCGLARAAFSGLFWLGVLAALMVLLQERRWDASSWLGFGAVSAALVTGVFQSIRILQDVVGVGVSVIGLLVVTAVVFAIPRR